MVEVLRLTRKELGAFLPDQRSIRAFENLFQTVNTIEETVIVIGGGGEATISQADSVSETALQTAKGNQVLLWLSM